MREPSLASNNDKKDGESISKATEWQIVFLVTFIILPAAAIAVVGSYGFIVWALQAFFGPPGHVG